MKNIPLYTDVVFCLIILPLMIFMFPVERWWATSPLFFIGFVGWLYINYFLYKYYIVPGLFHFRKRHVVIFATIALSLIITFLFASYRIQSPFYHLRRQFMETTAIPVWGVRQSQQAVWLHYIIVVTFCFAMGMLTEAYNQRLAREAVEYERNKAELALYKAQINPHFLFNTLNTLYGLLITHSDKTEATLERFINLVRYTYVNADREFIPLEEEADYIGQYINLQKLRLNEFADVQFEQRIENASTPVPPMLLITFVENAFKYGISSDTPCFIHIRLSQQAETVSFEVENSVSGRKDNKSQRTGIANCRRRLSLLYPDRHHLDVGIAADGTFRVALQIKSPHVC